MYISCNELQHGKKIKRKHVIVLFLTLIFNMITMYKDFTSSKYNYLLKHYTIFNAIKYLLFVMFCTAETMILFFEHV